MDVKLGSDLKDETHPIFTTQQTGSMFILTSHLKGYKRKDIKIEINEDGSKITISGEKPRCEVDKQVEMRGFRRTFTIPEGVILDKVKARFDRDESRLIIRMPKSVQGIVEVGIQEYKETENPNQENHVLKNEEIVGSFDLKQEDDAQQVAQNQEYCKSLDTNELKPDNKIQSESAEFGEEKAKEFTDENNIKEVKPHEKSSIICTPIIAGSTLFVTLIVVVLSLFRSKSGSREKRN